MTWDNTTLIELALINSWGSSAHSVVQLFSREDVIPEFFFGVRLTRDFSVSVEMVGIRWGTCEISQGWTTVTSSDYHVRAMSFSISFLSKSYPELIAMGCSKDWTTCPFIALLLNWEVVVHPNSLINSIFVKMDSKKLFSICLGRSKQLLNSSWPFRKRGK